MGSRKSQQEQVRCLLKDAIMMLCRKGLADMSTFSVEALIGITLEDGDVMLVSIKESMDGPGDFSSTQLGAALNRIFPNSIEGDDEDLSATWPSKRRLLPKTRALLKSRRKRGRPRKLTVLSSAAVKMEPSVTGDKDAAVGDKDGDDAVADGDAGDNDDEEGISVIQDDRSGDEGDTDASGSPEKKKNSDFAALLDSSIPQVGPYNCSMCSAVYKYRKCLIEHQLKVHQPKTGVEEEKTIHPCDVCEKVFSSRRSLLRHVVVHSADREKIPCQICQKKFSCQRHMEFHIRTVHEGLYPYMCELCGKPATTKNSLAGHMASKHKVDRIKCSKCEREYSSQITFVKHTCAVRFPKYSETVCSVCNKSFEHPKQLVQHMSKHLDPRIQCELCGRSFKWASSLTAHKVAAHKDVMQAGGSGQGSGMGSTPAQQGMIPNKPSEDQQLPSLVPQMVESVPISPAHVDQEASAGAGEGPSTSYNQHHDTPPRPLFYPLSYAPGAPNLQPLPPHTDTVVTHQGPSSWGHTESNIGQPAFYLNMHQAGGTNNSNSGMGQ